MTFAHPILVPIGLAVSALVLVAFVSHRRRRRRLAAYLGGRRAAGRLSRPSLYRLRIERLLLVVVSALATALAAAEPTSSVDEGVAPTRSVVLAIDVSASMQAADVEPTRLGRAVEVAGELLDALTGDRVGALLFSGTAYTLAPPTRDHEVLRYLLSGVTPTMATAHDPGTLMSIGIRAATELWSDAPEPGEERSIILIGDGETSEATPSVLEATRDAVARGIAVHVIGVGTVEGSGMTMPRAAYQLGGPVLGDDGEPAVSRLDERVLGAIAEAGAGRYARAGEAGHIEGLRAQLVAPVPTGSWWSGRDLGVLFLAVALVCLALDSLLDVRWPTGHGAARRPA